MYLVSTKKDIEIKRSLTQSGHGTISMSETLSIA